MKATKAAQNLIAQMRNEGLKPGVMIMALSIAKQTIKKDAR